MFSILNVWCRLGCDVWILAQLCALSWGSRLLALWLFKKSGMVNMNWLLGKNSMILLLWNSKESIEHATGLQQTRLENLTCIILMSVSIQFPSSCSAAVELYHAVISHCGKLHKLYCRIVSRHIFLPLSEVEAWKLLFIETVMNLLVCSSNVVLLTGHGF